MVNAPTNLVNKNENQLVMVQKTLELAAQKESMWLLHEFSLFGISNLLSLCFGGNFYDLILLGDWQPLLHSPSDI